MIRKERIKLMLLLCVALVCVTMGTILKRGVDLHTQVADGILRGTIEYTALEELKTSFWSPLYRLVVPKDEVLVNEALGLFKHNMRGGMEIARGLFDADHDAHIRVKGLIIFGEGAFKVEAYDQSLHTFEACLRINGAQKECKAGIERLYIEVAQLMSRGKKGEGMSEAHFKALEKLEEMMREKENRDGKSGPEGGTGSGRDNQGGSPI